ncbi:MAG: hypothetical protein ACRDUY_11975 [Nitriliruptorales bacterium]
MAEERRLTKRQRRERARREGARKEQEQRRRARRCRFTAVGGTILGVAGIVVLLVVTREPPATTGITIDEQAAEAAAAAAGCATVDIPALSASHVSEPAPPPEQLYPVRPTHSGPHVPSTAPVGAFDDSVDERATTHNLEPRLRRRGLPRSPQ